MFRFWFKKSNYDLVVLPIKSRLCKPIPSTSIDKNGMVVKSWYISDPTKILMCPLSFEGEYLSVVQTAGLTQPERGLRCPIVCNTYRGISKVDLERESCPGNNPTGHEDYLTDHEVEDILRNNDAYGYGCYPSSVSGRCTCLYPLCTECGQCRCKDASCHKCTCICTCSSSCVGYGSICNCNRCTSLGIKCSRPTSIFRFFLVLVTPGTM